MGSFRMYLHRMLSFVGFVWQESLRKCAPCSRLWNPEAPNQISQCTAPYNNNTYDEERAICPSTFKIQGIQDILKLHTIYPYLVSVVSESEKSESLYWLRKRHHYIFFLQIFETHFLPHSHFLRMENEVGSVHDKTTRVRWMQKEGASSMQNDATSHVERGEPRHTRRGKLCTRRTKQTPGCSKNELGSTNGKIYFEEYEYGNLDARKMRRTQLTQNETNYDTQNKQGSTHKKRSGLLARKTKKPPYMKNEAR
ncbi:hypothetical protein DVH24_024741 [Malus domestica]|uniref:Uncharacterized protein n=1 Tax=Malus domestica TaxID=3750 RepID=A0A498JJI5_MALDO|nr:hypothetical protein DVH24_024741 [Malus domestica]